MLVSTASKQWVVGGTAQRVWLHPVVSVRLSLSLVGASRQLLASVQSDQERERERMSEIQVKVD